MSRHARRPRLLPTFLLFSAFFASSAVNSASGRDWVHWRGPEENGVSREKNLPGDFDPKAGAKGNVIWKQPFGGRSAPLVLDGKLYLIQGVGEGLQEGEQVACFEEATGKPLWKYRVNVFHTDIVSSRLGWTTLTADPATKTVYAHTTGGYLLALNPEGKLLWSRSLSEEFGRVTGYGGRIASPVFDSGLVVLGMVNASWGDQNIGRNRFVAFDGKTGELVWWHDTGNPNKGTYYSNPVVAVINGQRLLISGGSEGSLHALKVRTGEKVWSYHFSAGVVNGSPIVDGNLVYCSHGEDNPEGGAYGRVICVDGSQVDPKTQTPKLVWEQKDLGKRFGLASGAFADGRYYLPDDSGTLFCFDGKTGKVFWEYRYGTEVRGAPLVADGKIYIFDVKGRFLILELNKDPNKKPNEANTFDYKFKDPKGFLVETNGTPIAVNGRVYFTTRNELYALGDPKAKPECGAYKPLPAETPFKENAIAAVRIFPADVTAKAGETVKFDLVLMDANGREVKSNLPNPPGEWSLPVPPKTPAGLQPPALNGKVEGGFGPATLTLGPLPGQQGYVDFKAAGFTSRARVRVVPPIPYKQDFTNVLDGAAPGGWINAQGKFVVKTMPDGNKVLAKTNTDPRPPISRANCYITLPTATNYAIQTDIMGMEVRRKLPDMGVVNCRYTLILDGKIDTDTGKRQLKLLDWEGRRRIDVAVEFDWQSGTWYTLKFEVEQKEKTALVRGKVWKRGDKEPEKWTIEFEDPSPNREGAAALYGYITNIDDNAPGSEISYDNLNITPNGKK